MTTPPIFSFFKKIDNNFVPTNTSPLHEVANKAVERELQSTTPESSSKKGTKRKYTDYSAETRSKIAKYAIENGNTAAARYFSKEFGTPVNESTVRGIKKSYEKIKKSSANFQDQILSLPKSPRGRQLKLGDLDSKVCDYLRNLRLAGGIVNSRIVLAAAKGIVSAENKSLLAQYGGRIKLDKPWATSILRTLNMVKRKGTKGVKSLPENFENIKDTFLKRISNVIEQYNIPDNLIINWDQTGSNFVPVSDWTMHLEGSKQVPISHIDDKRQMTVLLGCKKSGVMLPPQLIYQGRTDLCHPTCNFPETWDITHTESHWSTSDSMLRYVDKVILPYIDRVIDEDDLPLRQHALCLFDDYTAHRGEQLLDKLKERNIHVVFIPACCTDQLQPLDLGINAPFKQAMKSKFEDYYASAVADQLKSDIPVDKVEVDLKLGVVKPLHAKWLLESFEEIRVKTDLVSNAWGMAGIDFSK